MDIYRKAPSVFIIIIVVVAILHFQFIVNSVHGIALYLLPQKACRPVKLYLHGYSWFILVLHAKTARSPSWLNPDVSYCEAE